MCDEGPSLDPLDIMKLEMLRGSLTSSASCPPRRAIPTASNPQTTHVDGRQRMSFHPTPAQQRFLEAALNPNVSKRIRAISRAAHVHESSWRTWKHNPAFLAWYQDAWQNRAASCSWLLDKIGLQQARHDFRFWKAMQEKYSTSPPGLRHPPLTVIIRAPRPLRRTSRLAPIDRGRGTGPSPNLPAIGGLGMDIGASDQAPAAPLKKREKNHARPDVHIKSQTVIGARPNRAR